jgi:ERCC4-type nuclease
MMRKRRMATAAAQIVLDMRESGLAAELTKAGIPYTVAALDVGDILIQSTDGAATPLLVAERKSFADFAASNTDGRYREQRARLMAVRGSGVAVLYILEGTWSGHDERVFGGGRVTEGLLKRLTTRLILRYGMPVLASTNLADTARWCGVLLAQLGDDPTVFHPESGGIAESVASAMTTYTASISTTKKANKGAESTAAGMLTAVPGLGAKKVTGLLAEKSVAELATMTSAEIGALTAGSGKRLGDKLGAVIYDALHWKSS